MFKSLVSALSEQRQEIKQALVLFPYFETWNADLIAECCRVSSIAEFPPNEIISGPDTGNSHTVYFVLDGVCKMVRNLDVEVKLDSCKKVMYKPHKIVSSGCYDSESKREGYSSRLFNQIFQYQDTSEVEVEENIKVNDEPEVILKENLKPEKEEECSEVEESSEENKEFIEEDEKLKDEESDLPMKENAEECPESEEKQEFEGLKEEENPQMLDFSENAETTTPPDTNLPEPNDDSENINPNQSEIPIIPTPNLKKPEDPPKESTPEEEPETIEKEVIFEADHHIKILEECKKRREVTIWVSRKTILEEKPPNVKRIFMQIGFLFRGACFGLEKSERENFILSATRVKCLKIPEGFLLRHNPCNIWKRIRLFHSLYLPKNEKVFERFKTDRMWVEGKKKLTEEIVFRKKFYNYTLICDAPYSMRLSEVR